MYDDGGKRQYPDPVIIEEDRPNSGSSLNGGDQSEYKETLNGGDQSEYGTKFSNFLDKLTGLLTPLNPICCFNLFIASTPFFLLTSDICFGNSFSFLFLNASRS
jgi:hypothetical protein